MAGVISAANLGGVADARLSTEPDHVGSEFVVKHEHKEAPPSYTDRKIEPVPVGGGTDLYNDAVLFEEYHYYAKETREFEKNLASKAVLPIKSASKMFALGNLFSKKSAPTEATEPQTTTEEPTSNGDVSNEKGSTELDTSRDASVVSSEDWRTAARAARTATWGAVFYLITTDILGPFSVPWAMKNLGYGPGAALYTIFGIMAAYSGTQLWSQFLGLDSERYPVKNYGDLAYRIFGSWARYVCNVLQSFQFFLNVALLIIGNGQGIAQLAAGPSGTGFLCFVVCEVIFMVAGAVVGQIRTLQRLGYLANAAVWMNLFIIFMTMGVASNTSPNYKAAMASDSDLVIGPVLHTAGTPAGLDIVDQINGLMQAVFSYGGATLFCELMAEMRRPWDFWKGMICAESLIFACYLVFGMVVYSQQGQFAVNPAYQGIDPYSWQTVGNVLSLLSGLIAAVLYGNIGIKVLYANVGRQLLRFPALETRRGKYIWVAFVPLYWICAWIVGAAIPQISYLSSFVGAACILQFSYTFPPILMVAYNCQADAITGTDGFDPSTGQVVRQDSGVQRWVRGFLRRPVKNTFDIIYFLGACTTAVLGIYASVVGMHNQFSTTSITPFGCASPV